MNNLPLVATATELEATRDEFVTSWGALGSAWGINRTLAQIHALLLLSAHPMTTDQIMKELKISRGNANGSLRELAGWGLIRSIVKKGERKEHFEAEKEIWKIFRIVIGERKRREVVPALHILRRCEEKSSTLKGEEAKQVYGFLKDLRQFIEMGEKIMQRVEHSDKGLVMPLVLKFMK
jgi:DNA-binding transcriptional regulator GbsR (MarR family)